MKIISAHHCGPDRWMLTLIHGGYAYLFHSATGQAYTVLRSRINAIARTRCGVCDERYSTIWYSHNREVLATGVVTTWTDLVADPGAHLMEILL